MVKLTTKDENVSKIVEELNTKKKNTSVPKNAF